MLAHEFKNSFDVCAGRLVRDSACGWFQLAGMFLHGFAVWRLEAGCCHDPSGKRLHRESLDAVLYAIPVATAVRYLTLPRRQYSLFTIVVTTEL